MVAVIWLVGFLITFYVVYQLWNPRLQELKEEDVIDMYVESRYFWGMILVPLFWYISIPIILLWMVLDRTIGKKFFNK